MRLPRLTIRRLMIATVVVGVVALAIGDREMMSQVLQRGRARRRGGSQG